MVLIRKILYEAKQHLAPGSVVVLEHGDLRAEIEAEFPSSAPHIFTLTDGSDAVLGFREENL